MPTRRLANGHTVTVERNDGLTKRCDCPRRKWGSCPHDWHFAFSWNGKAWRFSLDVELGKHVETKDDAKEHRDRIRDEIRKGTFVRAKDRTPSAQPATPEALTFTAYGAIFHARCPKLRGKHQGKPRDRHDASMLRTLAAAPGADGAPLGPRPIGSLTQADVEAAIGALRASGRSASHLNKLRVLASLMGRWGAKKGYLAKTWVRDIEVDSPLKRERGAKRTRRVEDDERKALLQQAPPALQRLIMAAEETCLREGELLGLQWSTVSLTRMELTVLDTKNGKSRTLPISPALKALLEMIRHDPSGREWPAAYYVFGTPKGTRVEFPRKTWESTVLRAHGITPQWTHNHKLTPECRAELRRIDLNFHDLRHEAASRLLESGWPLHHIQQMLGHATLAQTADYLNVSRMGLHDSMRRFGTLPKSSLHGLAPEAQTDQSPERKSDEAIERQPTVN